MMAKTAGDALQEAFDTINKTLGEGTIVRMGEDSNAKVERISTGIWNLDIALEGGFPLGRMVEIFGPESSGKSTLGLTAVAVAQGLGLKCAYIDAEHALDPVYSADLGVDIDELLLAQPLMAEETLEIIETLVDSGAVSVIVVDSVAAMTPRAEIEGDFGDAHVGLQARLMSQALRKLNATVYRNNVLLIWINQLRMKVGVIYGSPEVTPGGKALPYYASIRLDVRRIETVKQGTEAVANRTRIKVVKSKTSRPHRQVEFDLEYGRGIPAEGILLDLALDAGVIKKAGSWFATHNGEQLGQGRDKTKAILRNNPDMSSTIRQDILDVMEYASA